MATALNSMALQKTLFLSTYLLTFSVYADPIFSPYKDTAINFDWNNNTINTQVSGAIQHIATDIKSHSATAITIGFANGNCGAENWSGANGAAVASANKPTLIAKDVKYIIATGGQGGVFTCSNDSAMANFINRWNSKNFIGIDFDIESGQSALQINSLVQRLKAAHAKYPLLRFSFTLATEAINKGAITAVANLGTGKGSQDPYNGLSAEGNTVMAAIKNTLAWKGTKNSWPSYVKINLMVMDYGDPPATWFCVISGGKCQMGQSALQAAYNLASVWNIPMSGIELTPMIGGNDITNEQFQLADVDTLTRFALANGLAGVHYWSYDRDVPCATGPAKATCNSMGANTQRYAYLKRFVADGITKSPAKKTH